jgi:hypothetical protein
MVVRKRSQRPIAAWPTWVLGLTSVWSERKREMP